MAKLFTKVISRQLKLQLEGKINESHGGKVKMATLKKTKIGFQYRLSLNAGQKYCRMLQGEHSAILWTFIKLPFVIKTFVLSIFEWPFKTGFTVHVPCSFATWSSCSTNQTSG